MNQSSVRFLGQCCIWKKYGTTFFNIGFMLLLNCSVFQCGLFHLTEEIVVFTKITSFGLILNLSNL